ncbi:MAG: hypothetical protein WC087_03960 [Candidatus Paceibacterota bacterium]
MYEYLYTFYLTALGLLFLLYFLLFINSKKKEKKHTLNELSEEQFVAIRRHNNLFENVPIYSGDEWKTLSVEELVQVCLASRDAVYEMHGGKHDHSVILQETIDRCRSLADWMSGKQHSSFYMDSDMSHFIVKPREVAHQLEQINK